MPSPPILSSLDIQVVLQHYCRGRSIQSFFAAPPASLPQGEAALGLAAGQAVVAPDNRYRGLRPKGVDERDHARGLIRGVAVETGRHADDDRREAIFLLRKASDHIADACHRVLWRHDQRCQRPRQRPGHVADGETDPAPAVVDPHHTLPPVHTHIQRHESSLFASGTRGSTTRCYTFRASGEPGPNRLAKLPCWSRRSSAWRSLHRRTRYGPVTIGRASGGAQPASRHPARIPE